MSRCSRRVMGRIANLTLRQGGGKGISLGVDIAQGRLQFRGMRHHESKHRMRRNSRRSRSPPGCSATASTMERCWRLCGRQRPEERVRLRLVNRAFERYVRYRRGRNEKNESRTVFENLKAAFSEHLTHTRFISRKVGFSSRPLDFIARAWHPRVAYLGPARRPTGLFGRRLSAHRDRRGSAWIFCNVHARDR
jgi:hypothetical protein